MIAWVQQKKSTAAARPSLAVALLPTCPPCGSLADFVTLVQDYDQRLTNAPHSALHALNTLTVKCSLTREIDAGSIRSWELDLQRSFLKLLV